MADIPRLRDEMICLQPMTLADAATHLAGEDELSVRFLSGGRSSIETVSAWILRNEEAWERAGPVRCFGIREIATSALIGMVEANLALPGVRDGVANVSYSLYPAARGKGFATRAVKLMVGYLRDGTNADVAMIQARPENDLSAAVARRSGFRFVGERISGDGDRMQTFILHLRARCEQQSAKRARSDSGGTAQPGDTTVTDSCELL
jgi:RimJ/RimL family protein N-acetyltransferase